MREEEVYRVKQSQIRIAASNFLLLHMFASLQPICESPEDEQMIRSYLSYKIIMKYFLSYT